MVMKNVMSLELITRMLVMVLLMMLNHCQDGYTTQTNADDGDDNCDANDDDDDNDSAFLFTLVSEQTNKHASSLNSISPLKVVSVLAVTEKRNKTLACRVVNKARWFCGSKSAIRVKGSVSIFFAVLLHFSAGTSTDRCDISSQVTATKYLKKNYKEDSPRDIFTQHQYFLLASAVWKIAL